MSQIKSKQTILGNRVPCTVTEESVKVGVEGNNGRGELRTGEGGKQELSEGGKRQQK